MPKIEDMHSALRGCTVFSVLDLKQAYHQIPVSKDSQKYLTINTTWTCLLLKDDLMAFIQVKLCFRELWMVYWLIFQKLLVD